MGKLKDVVHIFQVSAIAYIGKLKILRLFKVIMVKKWGNFAKPETWSKPKSKIGWLIYILTNHRMVSIDQKDSLIITCTALYLKFKYNHLPKNKQFSYARRHFKVIKLISATLTQLLPWWSERGIKLTPKTMHIPLNQGLIPPLLHWGEGAQFNNKPDPFSQDPAFNYWCFRNIREDLTYNSQYRSTRWPITAKLSAQNFFFRISMPNRAANSAAGASPVLESNRL